MPDTLFANMPNRSSDSAPSRGRTPAPSHSPIESGIGARLREARVRAGFHRQTDFAKSCGVSPITLNRHELGRVIPCVELIRVYAAVSGVSASYLQYGIGDPTIPRAVVQYLKSWKAHSLLEETRLRLQRVPWSVIALGEIDEFQVHELAKLIDRNLRPRSHSADADPLSSASGQPPDDPRSEGTDPRCAQPALSQP